MLFKLFNIDKMKSNKSINQYIKNLKNKFKNIKINITEKKEMDNKTIEKIINIIKIIIKKQNDKVIDFFHYLEIKLNENNYIEIYIKLLENNEINLNDSIFKHILLKINNSKNIILYSIKYLNTIKDLNKRKKYFDSIKEDTFEYKDFFENNKNKEINLFISLTKFKLFDEESKKTDFYKKNNKTIIEVKNKFKRFEIELSNIDSLLKLEESKILERFQIINDNPKALLQKIKQKYMNKILFNYCNFKRIQDFDENLNDSNSISKKVDENINSGIFYFYKKKDEYRNNKEKIKNGFNYLFDLKYKLYIKSDEKDENMKEKNNRLKYFDKLVNKIAKIRDIVNYLRNKGSQIELLIEVHFCYNVNKNTGKFILYKKEQTYKYIINYLNDVKNYYNDLLMSSYLEKEYLRFTYGKQFNLIVDYLRESNNDNSFAYYFLNEKPRKQLNREFLLEQGNNINFYKTYLQNTLENISKYIQKYFEDNYGSEILEKDGKKIQIRPLEKFYNQYEVKNSKIGFNFIKTEDKSIEEVAIDLFIEFTGKFPISQNIILINKETSDEELECFLFRSILCNYHTLFIIGLNDITNSQEDNLLNIINKLVDYIKIKDNKNIKNLSKIKAKIKSCIIFIYNHDSNIIDNIAKITNYNDLTKKKEQNEKFLKNIDSLKFKNRQSFSYDKYSNLLINQDKIDEIKYNNNKIGNTFIYISDVNGTGKTFEIKNQIKMNKLFYKYFPLGGHLTKNLVYNKIKELLNDIENE